MHLDIDRSPLAGIWHVTKETLKGEAAPLKPLRRTQAAVLAQLRTFGPSTDADLVRHYGKSIRAKRVIRQSPSGIRSRRAELVLRGLVSWTGKKRKMPTGGWAKVWKVVK